MHFSHCCFNTYLLISISYIESSLPSSASLLSPVVVNDNHRPPIVDDSFMDLSLHRNHKTLKWVVFLTISDYPHRRCVIVIIKIPESHPFLPGTLPRSTPPVGCRWMRRWQRIEMEWQRTSFMPQHSSIVDRRCDNMVLTSLLWQRYKGKNLSLFFCCLFSCFKKSISRPWK